MEQNEMPTAEPVSPMAQDGAVDKATDSGDTSPKETQHYNSVKMKYFRSLGVNQPPRERGQTVPTPIHIGNHYDAQDPRPPISPSRRRSTSTPINITTQGIPIPNTNGRRNRREAVVASVGTFASGMHSLREHGFSDEDDDDEDVFNLDEQRFEITEQLVGSISPIDEEQASASQKKVRFVPPHEMKRNRSFEVGTAPSLAVWEAQRRNHMVV